MTDTKAKAVAYYSAFGRKDIEAMEEYLHPEIEFTDPMEKIKGREVVLKAAKGFTNVFKTLTIRSSFGSEDQAVIILEMDIPGVPKSLQSASLLSFEGGLISKIELFYDASSLKR